MNNILITGEIGIGKSTIIEKVLDMISNKNLCTGGYKGKKSINKEIDKTTITFSLESLTSLSSYEIIVNDDSNFKIYSESFNEYSAVLDNDLKNCDLLILDEIGFAESKSLEYIQVLNKVLDSDKIVFGVLKKHHCNLVSNIKNRDDVTLFDINKENRDFIYKDIYEYLSNLL